jgi:dienelactone hydrolase
LQEKETPLKTRNLLLAFLAGAMAIADLCGAQTQSRFHFAQSPGLYAVGLKVVNQYDPSRTWGPAVDELGKPIEGAHLRPLQTLIWYPAMKGAGSAMTVGDYAKLLETETSFDKPDLAAMWKGWMTGLAPSMKDSLWAVRDAAPAAGKFPIVVYTPSFGVMSWENADLCEFLASHGYVVVAAGALGATSRGMTTDLAGINAQARDVEFLVGYAQSLANADPAEVAVAGFSWGGIANLFAAARDSRIAALVALDGSMRYYPGLVKDAGDVHPELMTIPLLFFAQGGPTLEDQERYLNGPKNQGPNALNAWTHGDLEMVRMLGMVHQEFSSMYQRNEPTWGMFAESQPGDYTREDGIPGYAWVAKYAVEFLDAYLKHDAASLEWLKKTPAENGVPPHLLAARFRAGAGIPATAEAFRLELGRRGFDRIDAVYADFHKQNPAFKMDESEMNMWGYALMGKGHAQEAIAVLRLNTALYPESGNTYDSLGDAYASAGDKKLAMENFKKAAGMDFPGAAESKKKLDALEKEQAGAKQ